MKVPSTSSTSLFPSWLTNMTIVSLFMSIFGISLFSILLLGTSNVDMLTILSASEMLPNPFDVFQLLVKLYEFLTQWIKKIPDLNGFVNPGGLVGSLLFIANLVINLVKNVITGIILVLVCAIGIVFIPIYLICWCINTIFILLSIINGTAGNGYVPYVLDLSVITDFIERGIVL